MTPAKPPNGSDAGTELPADWRTQLKQRFGEHATDPGSNARGISGVLVPLLDVEPEPLVLYTRRSEHLSAHPGEISFPGGGLEPDDAGPRETALRETEEEIGLPRDAIELAGHVTDFHTHHDILICAYLGFIDPDTALGEPSTPHEVAERLLVPLSALSKGRGEPLQEVGAEVRLGQKTLGRVYPVEAYEGRQLPRDVRDGGRLHYWRLADATTVWGITGELTARFLRAGLDWEPPEPPTRMRGIDEVQP